MRWKTRPTSPRSRIDPPPVGPPEIDPNVLTSWNFFTIDVPLLWGQYWDKMDWLLIAIVSAFAIVTIFLGVCCFHSPKVKQHPKRGPSS
jgi:hypothetical protein